MALSKTNLGHIALLLAQVIYAMNYSIAKDLMPTYLQPLALVVMRILGAAVLFWLVSLFAKKEKVAKEDLKKLLWLSLFGIVINQVFFIWGLSLTTPIN
ncbi:MAG: EamA family transporter, partial [Sphingobacteriaceae bacterium]